MASYFLFFRFSSTLPSAVAHVDLLTSLTYLSATTTKKNPKECGRPPGHKKSLPDAIDTNLKVHTLASSSSNKQLSRRAPLCSRFIRQEVERDKQGNALSEQEIGNEAKSHATCIHPHLCTRSVTICICALQITIAIAIAIAESFFAPDEKKTAMNELPMDVLAYTKKESK